MRRLQAGLVGAAGGAAAFLLLRRRRRGPAAELPPPADTRADELRRKLEESRALVEEREQDEARETPVDRAESVPGAVDERRREVHERARTTAEQMRAAEPDE